MNLIANLFESALDINSIKNINIKILVFYMVFNAGQREIEISYSKLGISNKKLYGLFSTANSSDGKNMPELQVYSTSTGIKGSLHLGNDVYIPQNACGFHVLAFHD